MKQLCLLIFCVGLWGCGNGKAEKVLSVIPQPYSIEINSERVKISGCSYDVNDVRMNDLAQQFSKSLSLPVDGDGVAIKLSISDTLGREEYKVVICDTLAMLQAGSYAGIMYGLNSLDQLYDSRTLPKVVINDKPQYQWRGFMLDASRHFWTVDQTKKFIDILAFHKINKFHWHLTDGIGWRIEIKRYPELTQKAAWRLERKVEAPWVNWSLSSKEDSLAYGGFYTQEEIRDVVAYADSKFIEVIPEIEMPGHSEAVLMCYPNLKCVEGQSSGEFCAGKEATYEFLTNVLDEVAGLFPSKYIHVGGDEVDVAHWKNCPDCARKMKAEGISDVANLQGYFMERIKEHLHSRQKVVCGWDEIVNSGVDTSVVVFSWTGWENGVKAAKEGNKVVMCPLDYVYLDHYQGQHKDEPQGWGGDNNIKRVYDFPVIPNEVEGAARENILGGQANLWTENIRTFDHVQYMLLPRLAALSEALWSAPQNKNWANFKDKLKPIINLYQTKKWGFSTSALDPFVSKQWIDDDGNIHIELSNYLGSDDLYYTLDGTLPNFSSNKYDTTIVVESPATLLVLAQTPEGHTSRTLMVNNLKNLATGKPVKYNNNYSQSYNGGGDAALTDNQFAFKKGDDKRWQGFESVDFDVEIDLQKEQIIRTVEVNFFQHMGATSVMLPREVTASTSLDGKNWTLASKQLIGHIDNFDAFTYRVHLDFIPTNAKYVRIQAVNMKVLPFWHLRKGANAWIFVDEISVN